MKFSPLQKLYTDIEYILGCSAGQEEVQKSLYLRCKNQFHLGTSKYSGITEEQSDDLFHDSYLILWQKIENGDLYVEGKNILTKGKNGLKTVPDLLGYFMRIVKNKYLEKLRENGKTTKLPLNEIDTQDESTLWWETDPEVLQDRIIYDCIRTMPAHCYELLKKFYFEKKSLQEILAESPQHSSYNALKTSKFKCLKTLKMRIRMAFSDAGLNVPKEK